MTKRNNRPVMLISGAASGIGLACARWAAVQGWRVVGGYFPGDPHDPQVALASLGELAQWVSLTPLDVARAESVDHWVEEAVSDGAVIDAVVASAGILRHAALGEMTEARWDELLNVDLGGVMRLFRAASCHMSGPGSMVAISSIAGGVYGWEAHAHYAAAKAGVLGLCRSLAIELAPRRIRCNAVVPGLIETPQSLDAINSLGSEGLRQAASFVPLQRIGRADEVAELAGFLCSERAAYITGQSIIIDGGLTVRLPR